MTAAVTYREPPYSAEAEAAVLGACLINPRLVPVLEFLGGNDFYLVRHAHVWAAMLRIIKREGPDSLDTLTLQSELDAMRVLNDIGGPAFITGLMIDTPSSTKGEIYARLVERAAMRRRSIERADKLKALAFDESFTVNDLLSAWGEALAYIRGAGLSHKQQSLDELVSAELDRVEAARDGKKSDYSIRTGLDALDSVIGGWHKGEFVVFASRPGMGKTSFLLGTAIAAAREGKSVCWAALEMTAAGLTRRLMSQLSGVPDQRIRLSNLTADEYSRTLKAGAQVADLAPYIHMRQHGTLTPEGLRSEAYQVKARHGLDLLIVDYLQLLSPSSSGRGKSRYELVTEITLATRALAQEFNIPVIVAAQLSRAVEQRQDKRPMLSDLKESGQIEQDADIVAFLYRDAYYDRNTDQPNQADIIISKNRNGPTGLASVYFDAPTMTFRNGRQLEVSLSRNAAKTPQEPF